MNKRIKKAWLKKLRSGKVLQTTGQLMLPKGHICIEGGQIDEKHDRFCCLGVLTCVVNKSKKVKDFNDGFPSDRVQERAGIDGGVCSVLSAMNDDGCSFSKIATYIEKYL